MSEREHIARLEADAAQLEEHIRFSQSALDACKDRLAHVNERIRRAKDEVNRPQIVETASAR
jgi:septal ring factor EnvC (AmiA/AmiB activator)